jgi:hypothetical protein
MKPKNTLVLLAGLLAFGSAEAQTVARSSDPTAPAKAVSVEEKAIVLNPFVVNTDKDTGYQPQSTLAGTRLNTPIKDLASGISVLTRDFISDVGATNINELLIFSVGAEAAGSQGNFGAASADDTGQGVRNTPQSSTRTRGLAAPTNTRGYFTTAIPLDEYNTDFVTVNRGANAILFGIGSPAGVIDTTLVGASLLKDTNKVVHRYGDTGSNRLSLALNRVLLPQKLALRINAVRDDERYLQKPAFENKERIFGAVKYQPLKSTTLTASFENGRTTAARPLANLPYDSSRLWRDAGSVPFNWKRYDDPSYPGYVNALAGTILFNQFPTLGEGQIFGGMMIFPRNADMSVPRLANGTLLAGFRMDAPNGTGLNQLRSGLIYTPTGGQLLISGPINQDLLPENAGLGAGIEFYETTNYGEASDQKNRAAAFGIPGSRFGADATVPFIRPPGQSLQTEGFKDNNFFAWDKRMIDETGRQVEKFRTWHASVAHTHWADERGADRIGIEFTYNKEVFSRTDDNKFTQQGNSNHIRIDPNVYLANGLLNPNVGRPYINGGGQVQKNRVYNERENARATAFLRQDFTGSKSSVLSWLGRHTLTGLYEQADLKEVTQSSKLKPFGSYAETIAADPNGFSRNPAVLAYIGDSIFNVSPDGSVITLKNSPLQFQPITGTLQAGFAGPVIYFATAAANNATNPPTPATPTTTQGGFATSDTSFTEYYTGGTARRNLITSKAAVLQSYWAKNLLISTLGWRRDEREFAQKSITVPAPGNGYGATAIDGSGSTYNTTVPAPIAAGYQNNFENSYRSFQLKNPVDAQTGEIRSYNLVAKWPQALMRLPFNSDLSIFFGDSKNFSPEGAGLNVFQDKIAGATGRNKEWGFNLSLGDKLSLRVNRFMSKVVNVRNSRGLYGTMVNNGLLQNAQFWWNSDKQATPGLNREAEANEILNLVPGIRQLSAWTINPTNGQATYTNPGGSITDTDNIEAKGLEFEVTYNPFSGLRVTGNVAKQEAARTNIAPAMKKLFGLMDPYYKKYGLYPRGGQNITNYPVLGPLAPDSPVWTDRNSEWWRTNVAESYAAILDTENTSAPEIRKWRANLIANYTFSRNSKLKGWSVGTAARWEDKAIIGYLAGYRPIPAGAAPGTLPAVYTDPNGIVTAPATTYIDGWVGYQRKIFTDKINWSVRLSGRNLLYDSKPIVIKALGNGQAGLTRIPPEQRFYIANTFEF